MNMTTTLHHIRADEVEEGDLVHRIAYDVPLCPPLRVDDTPTEDGDGFVIVHMEGVGSPRYRPGVCFEVERSENAHAVFAPGTVMRGLFTGDLYARGDDCWFRLSGSDCRKLEDLSDANVSDHVFYELVSKPAE